jgi:hypothetical protein
MTVVLVLAPLGGGAAEAPERSFRDALAPYFAKLTSEVSRSALKALIAASESDADDFFESEMAWRLLRDDDDWSDSTLAREHDVVRDPRPTAPASTRLATVSRTSGWFRVRSSPARAIVLWSRGRPFV